jgi:hypothetical protein
MGISNRLPSPTPFTQLSGGGSTTFGFYPKICCNRVGDWIVLQLIRHPLGGVAAMESGESEVVFGFPADSETSVSVNPAGRKQQRSSIAFPYVDLEEVSSLAKAIHENVGSGSCSADQLAAWIKQSPTSSGFRLRLSAGKLFGLLGVDGEIRLTNLGHSVIDPKTEQEGRSAAFLSVPLYRAVFERFKGRLVPPTTGFENELVTLGVASTLKERARSVLERSAEYAGFYKHGRERLIQPANPSFKEDTEEKSDEAPVDHSRPAVSSIGEKNLGLDPLLIALLQKIPSKDDGWPAQKRLRWFRAFAMNVSQVFDEDHEPVELKIEIEQA